MGVTIVYCGIVYGLNTLVDLVHRVLDPRVARVETEGA
jgi:ABC-type dipeptide/oligopeptide/nickel transport system permease component